MDQKIIAIDIDDVIAESTEVIRKIANKQTNSNVHSVAYTTQDDYWGYYERVWAAHGIHDLKLSDVVKEFHSDQNHVPLLPGAEFAINEIMKDFHIILITSRGSEWKEETERWLLSQFGSRAPEVYFCNSHHDSRSKSKGLIAGELGAEWLIDDNVEHCLSALEEGLIAILFGDYGWQYKKPDHLINLQDWQAVLDYFQEQQKKILK